MVRIWDVTRGDFEVNVLEGNNSHISAVRFAPDGMTLCSGSNNGRIVLQSIDVGKELSMEIGI